MAVGNNPPKILLVEDNTSLSENISDLLKINNYEVTGIFESAEDVQQNIVESRPDLALIDIKLKGEKNGIELAKEIKREFQIPIVFITSASGKEIISKVQHIHPEGFIVKPFTKESLITTIELAIANFKTEKQPDTESSLAAQPAIQEELFIRENGWLKKIRVDEILWIKAEGAYSHIYVNGKQYTLRNTAKEILSKLKEEQFFRVHKSYIVNLNKIDAFNSSLIKINGSEIPIGRSYYKELSYMVNTINHS
ncbi:LytR/AlgR family response regulator transcription factor [Algoriphagus vanfongensis]|uniref:LytR/AlgR family response regulator transcription factor n=1 Tax=Algoriphagus vanfongensis TaxID=426371 RepID=UPI000557FA4B|nr:LytTR family transcriptional regulator DNA-binding domain-containing protein [Algoriphagus vanfongensis]